MNKKITVGEALRDPSTALGASAVRIAEDRALRLEVAQAIVSSEGITLEEALLRLWQA